MLTATQVRVLRALLEHPTYEAAAKAAGVSVRTVYNCRNDPEFAGEYKKACNAMLKSAAADAQRAMPQAVSMLCAMMQSEAVDDADRIRAARILLQEGMRITEAGDILERLEALEGKSQ